MSKSCVSSQFGTKDSALTANLSPRRRLSIVDRRTLRRRRTATVERLPARLPDYLEHLSSPVPCAESFRFGRPP